VTGEARLRRALDPEQRIDSSEYTDDEMEALAAFADRHDRVRLLRKVRRASVRRALRSP
jgi:hypothetical protein